MHCSGFCTTELFYLTLDLSFGIPEDTCTNSLYTEFGDDMLALGIAFSASALFMLLMYCCCCPLMCYDKDKHQQETRNLADSKNQEGI